MKIQATQINPIVGDIEGNIHKVLQGIERARANGADVVIFPEMTLLGYQPEDLLLDHRMIDRVEKAHAEIAPATKGLFVAVGTVRKNPTHKEKPLFNSVAVFIDGSLAGFKDKILLPDYDIFDERRFFEPGGKPPIYSYLGRRIGITICEDAWQHAGGVGYSDYRRDPIAELCEEKVDLMLNLTASPYYYKRQDIRIATFSKGAKSLRCPVVMCNQVGANDQILFDGRSLSINGKGELVGMAKGFVEDDLLVDLSVEAVPLPMPVDDVQDLFAALAMGTRDYFHKQGLSDAIVGLSGGIDSAVTLAIAVEALGKEHVQAFNMPSRYSSKEGIADAAQLAKNFGISLHTIAIDSVFQQYLDLLGPFFAGHKENIAEENLQARIRGMLLMAYSNKFGSLVLVTSNKSETAMGFSTLYGDMAGGLGVLQDVTKTNVYRLAQYINAKQEKIPKSILTKTPSPELKAGQTAFDRLPPFELLDPILEDYLEGRLSPKEIAAKRGQPLPFVDEIIRKVHAAEYKRRQAPIGLRVTPKAFSRGRIVPIVQKWIH